MLTDTELIRKLDFFEPLDQKIIKNIASLCIVREFATGEAIVRQGEAGLGLYFITGGKAKVEIDKDGNKIVVAELKEGDFLGEFSLIDEKTRSASVICLQDTRCLLLTRDTFSKLLNKHPEIAAQMLRTLVSRIRSTNDRVTQAQPPAQTSQRGAAPAPAATIAAAVAPDAAASPGANGGSGLSAATQQLEQLAGYLPKPEEVMEFYVSTKGRTQSFLNRFVSAIYAMKAMLRFSMAIVGCPVTVSAENPGDEVLSADCNGVKLLLFPAAEDQTILIDAVGDGMVSATVYRPFTGAGGSQVEVLRLAGPIREKDCVRLHVPVGGPMEVKLPATRRLSAHPRTAPEVSAMSAVPAAAAWNISDMRWD